ncbi:MAG: aminotransferase class IV [Deltaproteobacteria bacterium]|nr:aminotransferase class IV [Deltaproteobacteria bacterium]
MIGYLNGQYLPQENIVISPEDRGFLFADGIYDVIRSYNGKLFRAKAHLDRLSYGAGALQFNQTDFGYLEPVCERLIQDNRLYRGDAVIYMQVTRGVAPRSHAFPPIETPLTVYATARPFQPHQQEAETGIRVILVPDQRWARCDVKTIGLLANTLAHQRARTSLAAEGLFVRDGAVMEGTHSNVMAVFDGKVITPPRTNYMLAGITREFVLRLCGELSVPFLETPLYESDIRNADELMIVGTTVEVTPVIAVNGENIGSGEPGPLTRKLQMAFHRSVGFAE